MESKKLIILLIIIFSPLLLIGCTNKNEEGYIEIISLSGNEATESRYFGIKNPDNRLKIRTYENDSNGINGKFISEREEVVASFFVGDKPNNEIWPLNIKPGKYKIIVESTGTKFELIYQEKN